MLPSGGAWWTSAAGTSGGPRHGTGRWTPAVVYAGTNRRVFKSVDGGATWTGAVLFADVTGFAIDPATPTTVYVATRRSGVFKSFDAGGNWFSFNTGLTTFATQVLAIDPATPATVYVGTQIDGVFNAWMGSKFYGLQPRRERVSSVSSAFPQKELPGKVFSSPDSASSTSS